MRMTLNIGCKKNRLKLLYFHNHVEMRVRELNFNETRQYSFCHFSFPHSFKHLKKQISITAKMRFVVFGPDPIERSLRCRRRCRQRRHRRRDQSYFLTHSKRTDYFQLTNRRLYAAK
jgi:hypothetical protein